MGTITQNQQAIATIRQQRDQLNDLLLADKAKLIQLQSQLSALQRSGSENNQQQIAALQKQIDATNAAVQADSKNFLAQKQLAAQEAARLFITPPQQLIEQLSDRNPVLLTPVKIETRFKTDKDQNVLWIRIFPDSIAVNTHEKWLTQSEISSGETYWTNLFKAKTDANKQKGAWKVMVNSYGVNRATWVGLQTKPTNWGAANTVADLLFPVQPVVKPYPWSNAPHSKLLPDRFVATLYANNAIAYTAVGNFIPDNLIVGPDPSDENSLKTDNQLTAQLKTRNIIVGDDLQWMIDLTRAESVGMAIRINITPQEAVNGFDKIVVLGMKMSVSAAQSSQLLSDALDNHRYSKEGFIFLPNGTPTNNTDQGGSGYSFTQEDSDDSSTNYTLTTTPNFQVVSDYFGKADGQRFAETLQLPLTPLQTTPGSGGTDISDALYMNGALWPATMGYFLNEMLSPAISDGNIGQLQTFFEYLVTARGLLPSIRVGRQPYGLLVTSSFENWKWSQLEDRQGEGFLTLLQTRLAALYTVWQGQVANVAYYGKPGDDFQNLMNIVGMQGSSAEYYTRKAVTNAYSWNYLNFQGLNNANLTEYWNIIQLIQKLWIEALGINIADNPQIASLIYLDKQDLLQGCLVIDPYQQDKIPLPVAPLPDNKNYIQWLLDSDYNDINAETFKVNGQAVNTPACLLYMLLRNAYLQTSFYSILELIANYQEFDTLTARREVPVANMDAAQPMASKVDYFDADATRIFPSSVFSSANPVPMSLALKNPVIIALQPVQPLVNYRNALTYLSGKTQDVLERCFTEHLDLCSYRLDAWITGMFNSRLNTLRSLQNVQVAGVASNPNIDTTTGTYLGAFAWVEEVRPDTANKVAVPIEQIPVELQDPGATYYSYKDNGGYIHGFSQSHAVTAAVLKNAYLSHASQSDAGLMAVNLNSRRVRTALTYLDGIRNGQSMGALLGYAFERELHDNTSLNLDQYIYPIRQQFPLVTNKQILTEAGDPSAAIETTEANNVADGLALLEASRTMDYPYGVDGLPAAGTNEAKAIVAAVGDIADAQDAVGDLALAESVYQVTQGNFDRSGSFLKSVSEGNHPPEPDIVNTPRTGRPLTNRVMLQIPVAGNDTTWDGTLSPRANTEKGLNTWLESLIEKPDKIKCLVVTLTKEADGSLTESHTASYTVSDLGLSMLDLLYETGTRLGDGSSAVERRIAYRYRKDKNLSSDKLVRIKLKTRDSAWAADIRTFYQVLGLLNAARVMILESRALEATDFILPSELQNADEKNQKGFDAANLLARIQNVQTQLTTAAATLNTQIAASPVQLDDLRDAMMAVASFGWVEFIPTEGGGHTAAIKQTVVAQATTLSAKLTQALTSATALISHTAQTAGLTGTDKVNADVKDYLAAGQQLMSASFNALPRFTLSNNAELKNAATFSASGKLTEFAAATSAFPVEEWIQSAARVQPKMDSLEKLVLYNDLHNKKDLGMEALQLPYMQDTGGPLEDHWVATAYPDTFSWSGDKLSMAVIGNTGFAQSKYSGVLIDDWTESIPNTSEITGIAMNINQPNAMPPQSLLLAVPSQITGNWVWQDLMNILNETLTRAKMRAVEPDSIDTTLYSPLIPCVLSAFSTAPVAFNANFLHASLMYKDILKA
jgi:hypothetical protein